MHSFIADEKRYIQLSKNSVLNLRKKVGELISNLVIKDTVISCSNFLNREHLCFILRMILYSFFFSPRVVLAAASLFSKSDTAELCMHHF